MKDYKKGLALVVGINDYVDAKKLSNAVFDAESLSSVLDNLSFDVIKKCDIGYRDFANVLDDYYTLLEGYDVGVFYFAGHGVEINGENYLLAADTPIEKKTAVTMLSAKLQDIIGRMHKSGCQTNIIILDCCRNNPFPAERAHGTTNLAPVYAPQGMIIAYSTSPGETSKDGGLGKNSIYTGALLKHIDELCLPVEEFFKKVRTTVYNLTAGEQTSWEHTSLIGKFSFNSGQLIHSLNIPYSPDVVKDKDFEIVDSTIGEIIKGFKSYNYYEQQDALELFKKQNKQIGFNKNEFFIVGRNILQAAVGGCWECQKFMLDSSQLGEYTVGEENHLLNGILFEMYFNSDGCFRNNHVKNYSFDEFMSNCNSEKLACSFDFINRVLLPFDMLYTPSSNPQNISFEVCASLGEIGNPFNDEKEECYLVESLKCGNKELLSSDLLDDWNLLKFSSLNELEQSIAEHYYIPRKHCKVISNIDNIDKHIVINKKYQ